MVIMLYVLCNEQTHKHCNLLTSDYTMANKPIYLVGFLCVLSQCLLISNLNLYLD